MGIKKKKISDFPEANSMTGLWTLGYNIVDGIRKSVRIGLDFLKKAEDAALNAAKLANSAAEGLDGKIAGKADLDSATGYIKSSQIAPLQGRQTGVNTSDGYFSSDALALLFEGDRTHEICFTTGDDVTTDQRLFTTARGSQSNVQLFVSNGSMYAYIGSQLMNAGRVSPETSYHVLLSVDVANTTGKVYVMES